MPSLKNPACEVQLDRKRIHTVRNEISRIKARVALCATLPCASDHGYGSVGRDVRKTREPIRERRGGGNLQEGFGPSENCSVFIQRLGIVDQAEGVDGTLIGGE